MNENLFYLAVGIVGITVGLLASDLVTQDSTYCEQIEDSVRDNRSFNGSIGCYPPGVIETNLSDRVENSSELRCVCRVIDRSGVRLFPVAFSN